MGPPAIGSVVLVGFPYSDYLKFKKRPALVIGLADLDNLIICQITSKKFPSKSAINLSDKDFSRGGLQLESYIRPDKIYTIDPVLVGNIVGEIKDLKLQEVRLKLAALLGINKPS